MQYVCTCAGIRPSMYRYPIRYCCNIFQCANYKNKRADYSCLVSGNKVSKLEKKTPEKKSKEKKDHMKYRDEDEEERLSSSSDEEDDTKLQGK